MHSTVAMRTWSAAAVASSSDRKTVTKPTKKGMTMFFDAAHQFEYSSRIVNSNSEKKLDCSTACACLL